jgi:hypothetical protein
MRYFWFVIFVLSVGSVSAQNSARVRELEKQRKAALAEIEPVVGRDATDGA